MTDASRRVWPRQALVAERTIEHHGKPKGWSTFGKTWFTDAEFAAHFVPADRLDRLLAAVGYHYIEHNRAGTARSGCDLCAAWRDYQTAVGE